MLGIFELFDMISRYLLINRLDDDALLEKKIISIIYKKICTSYLFEDSQKLNIYTVQTDYSDK
jgi:hypothetical protein